MTAPSPIHRDPEEDDNDYGCFTDEGNDAVAGIVDQAADMIGSGTLPNWPDVVHFVRERLTELHDSGDGDGCLDTVVKENVFGALGDALAQAEIEVTVEDRMDIYGW